MNKTEQAVRSHKLVTEISDERNSDSGIWAYLKPFFHNGDDPLSPVHAVHEDTWTEMNKSLRRIVPCDCADCHEQPVLQSDNESIA